MNTEYLAKHIRGRAARLHARDNPGPEDFDNAELLKVLSRVLEGKSLADAFGAPGEWGYDTPIGDAVAGREVVGVE